MQIWSLTDPGCARTQNQDAFEIQKLKHGAMLFVVCDGMGGAKAGDVASSMAAREFTREIKEHYRASMSMESLDGLLEAIGLNRDKICTYCWTDEK
jgi:protein phosphatase